MRSHVRLVVVVFFGMIVTISSHNNVQVSQSTLCWMLSAVCSPHVVFKHVEEYSKTRSHPCSVAEAFEAFILARRSDNVLDGCTLNKHQLA